MNYEPISELAVSAPSPLPLNSPQRRCKSTSETNHTLRQQLEQDSISLPGQLDAERAPLNFAVITQQPCNEKLVSTSSTAARTTRTVTKENGSIETTGSHSDRDCDKNESGVDTMETALEMRELQDQVRSRNANADAESPQAGSQQSLVQSFFGEIDSDSSLGVSMATSSPSSRFSPQLDSIINYRENQQTRSIATRRNLLRYILYVLCALVVYPILMLVIPFSLLFKLLSQLCCCVPCRKRRHKSLFPHKQEFPLFFSSRPGGYHIIGMELNEHMDGESFVEYAISKLGNGNIESDGATTRKNAIFRLVSIVHRLSCFSWWEMRESVDLEEHVQIIGKRTTTNTNFTDIIEQLSRKDSATNKQLLWKLYFFPFFKIHGSSILLFVHHSILSGVNLKEILVQTFSDHGDENPRPEATFIAEFPVSLPSLLETVATGPGIVLSHLLRPSLSLIRASNKIRYAYSSPMYLHEACHIANVCNISLHSLFMACLSQSLRTLFSQKYPFGHVKVAIPVVSSKGQNSAFFVNLPLTKSATCWDSVRLQQLDKEIYANSKDSYILLSAAKLASLAFSSCTVDYIASSILRGADVLFHVVYCPDSTVYIDDHSISSMMYWPPLFNNINMGVCVVVYEQWFRVCIASDYGVTDWPDVLLKQFIASYSELYRTFTAAA